MGINNILHNITKKYYIWGLSGEKMPQLFPMELEFLYKYLCNSGVKVGKIEFNTKLRAEGLRTLSHDYWRRYFKLKVQ